MILIDNSRHADVFIIFQNISAVYIIMRRTFVTFMTLGVAWTFVFRLLNVLNGRVDSPVLLLLLLLLLPSLIVSSADVEVWPKSITNQPARPAV